MAAPLPLRVRRRASAKQAGFTLIELAVVIIVIALLLGSILVPLTSQVEQRKVLETQKTLDEIKEALIGFAMINGRLPRPANSFSDGTERGNCTTEAECTGFIPWTVLGVSKVDSYGKIIHYSVTPTFANAPFTLATVATKTVKTRSGGTVTALASAVPAVIFSQGANNWGTTDDGNAILDDLGPPHTNVDEDDNNNNDGTSAAGHWFWSRPAVSNKSATGGEFDDVVVWISPGVLLNRMVSAGKLP